MMSTTMGNVETKTIRVAIIEDHEQYREGVYYILQASEGVRCVGKYESIEDALPRLPAADVILLDIGLPGKSGIEGLRLIKEKYPDVQVIMLTVFDDDANIFRAILAGANGYLLKKTPPAQLLQAIEETMSGGMPMTPQVAQQAIHLFKRYVPPDKEESDLTPRELEILTLLVEGMNYNEISEKLFISFDTVRNHIRHIYEKLQVHSKSEAVAKAIRQGLV